MTVKANYKTITQAIKGYGTKLSTRERSDCVVCAMASALNVTYSKAHKFVRERYGRIDKKATYGFDQITKSMKNEVFFGKQIERYYPTDFKGNKCETVGQFLTYYKYKKGTFLIAVRSHVFAVKNGVVIGNWDDSEKLRRILRSVWKVSNIKP